MIKTTTIKKIINLDAKIKVSIIKIIDLNIEIKIFIMKIVRVFILKIIDIYRNNIHVKMILIGKI